VSNLISSPWRPIIEGMFCVLNKKREMVPFELNAAQALLDATLTGRDLVPKSRQLGVSTYMIARKVAKSLTLQNQRSVLISHKEEATKRLLATAHMIINSLRGPRASVKIEADTARLTQAEIIFNKTNSWFYIGTAGERAFGRGDTITDLHCSEYAWWPNPEELLKGALGSIPAPPLGEVCLESTGHGTGNDFESRCHRAARGESSWALHFLPWHEASEYALPLHPVQRVELLTNLREDFDEPRLLRDFGLTAEQLAWRRLQLDNFNNDLRWFKQEFPMTLDECFQTSGGTVFERIDYQPTISWKERYVPGGGEGALDGHPRADSTYIIGVDVGAGAENDASVIQVGCVETGEQVFRWHSLRTPPDVLGKRVLPPIGKRFNTALVVVESNNHGLTTLAALKGNYPPEAIFKRQSIDVTRPERGIMDWGYATTAKTKPLAVGRLRELLATNFIIHDELTHHELLSFVETETGRLEAQGGSHDDFVMALVMLATGWLRGSVQAGAKLAAATRPPKHWVGSTTAAILTDDLFDRPAQRRRYTRLGGQPQQINLF